MKCEQCQADNFPVFRTKPLGESPAGWRCWSCLTPEQREFIDPKVKDLVETIGEDHHGEG